MSTVIAISNACPLSSTNTASLPSIGDCSSTSCLTVEGKIHISSYQLTGRMSCDGGRGKTSFDSGRTFIIKMIPSNITATSTWLHNYNNKISSVLIIILTKNTLDAKKRNKDL